MVALLQSMGGDALMTRLVADPAIRLLLMSYDLISVDRRLMAEEALDTVRGHLHAHGLDVELIDVLGGVVYVQFHGVETSGVPEALARQDVERALREGLLGFQQLEVITAAHAAGQRVRAARGTGDESPGPDCRRHPLLVRCMG
jgi:Fe-S cluster biogenesis protein NfuA